MHEFSDRYPVRPFAAAPPFQFGHHHSGGPHGFCPSCCHPKSKCGCGCRECRKEPKELLVTPGQMKDAKHLGEMKARAAFVGLAAPGLDVAAEAAQPGLGTGTAFIGGGCCVHVSIEYAPSTPTAASLVLVIAVDSEGTILGWARLEKPGAGYQIKECIVTTKPGANLSVLVMNMTARVRWCEIFSC